MVQPLLNGWKLPGGRMTLLHSIILGIVQGLTEFLPVSSSGHLAIAQNLFHLDMGNSVFFDILLHIGTLAAVLIVYRKEILQLIAETLGMIRDLFYNLKIRRINRTENKRNRYRCIVSNNYRKMAVLMIVSTIPTALIGYTARKMVADAAETMLVPGICLVVTAILLFLSDRTGDEGKIPRDITYREGLIVGIAQGLAVLPGLSRSGATIAACLFCGFERSFAVKYSFILSVPAIVGAAVLEISQASGEVITPSLAGIYFAGMLFAGLVGYLCIRWMLQVVRNRKFTYFAVYCLIIGLGAIALHFFV